MRTKQKQVLETELINHCRTPAVAYAGRKMEYIHIKEWLEKRIMELELKEKPTI